MLLRDWLKQEDLNYQQAAIRIGCSRVSVYYWARGQNRPGAKWNSIISEITAGAVLANDHQNAFELASE
jgi:hypothetical protein